MRVKKRRPKGLKSVAFGKCPSCTAGKVGLLWQGRHLVWREHTYRTWSGTPMTCRASGVALCNAPEGTPTLAGTPMRCPHPPAGAA